MKPYERKDLPCLKKKSKTCFAKCAPRREPSFLDSCVVGSRPVKLQQERVRATDHKKW